MQISFHSNVSMSSISTQATGRTEAAKPKWDGKKVYEYLEDFGAAGIDYGKRAVKYYETVTEKDGAMTVDELKQQIGEMFSEYTMTDREPARMVAGKHYLYIDDSQLKKMAEDASYRAKVYGLLDREYTCGAEYTLRYSDGKNVTSHVTGSMFTLSEKNRKYAGADGVPYLGGCMDDHPFSSSESHCQVRSMSYLYDNLDPAKSAAKSRREAAAAKNEMEKRIRTQAKKRKTEKKKLEQILEKKRAARKEEAKKQAEKSEDRRVEAKEQAEKSEEKRAAEKEQTEKTAKSRPEKAEADQEAQGQPMDRNKREATGSRIDITV